MSSGGLDTLGPGFPNSLTQARPFLWRVPWGKPGVTLRVPFSPPSRPLLTPPWLGRLPHLGLAANLELVRARELRLFN